MNTPVQLKKPVQTVADLIAVLQKLPPTDRIVKDGPDGGFNDVEVSPTSIELVDEPSNVIGYQKYRHAGDGDDRKGAEFLAWLI
jgi:hypothetical protein